MLLNRLCFSIISLFLISIFSIGLSAQTITSGDVTGTITDPTGGSISGASVTLTNVNTNVAQSMTTDASGTYRFPFIPSGTYKLVVSANGFRTTQQNGIQVTAGQPTAANVQLPIATQSQTVNVVEAPPVLQTENADVSTSYNRESIENLPNPGGDITYIAQTAPGVVMNTQAGYGNFVAEGMPATSNLFTINGTNDNDPFFGINNSGASNLLLGSNDIAEASVITNAYSGQYGQYAGSQISYITKSGNNAFHGDAVYMWNGRALNANQFFSNEVGLLTPFNNFNQWQTGVSGPIVRNKTFFDVDYEGLRNLLPTAANLNLVPSPQFQAATLANLTAVGHADEIPFYQQAFAIYNNAQGVGSAVPVPGGGCQGFTGLAAGVPCADQFRTTPPNTNREYLWSGRVDQVLGSSDRGYIRVERDNGFQPTYTSPFGSTFNAQSNQPQMEGQVSETHIFGANTVNEFKGSGLFYAALFVPSNPTGSLDALPTDLTFAGGSFSSVGAFGAPGPNFFVPNGRRVWQYQVLDDISHVRGNHTFRAGFSWLHWTITDLDFASIGGPIHGFITTSLTDFFNGGGPDTALNQAFPTQDAAHLLFNTYGGYVADDWKVTHNLTVSLNLRLESYANPVCQSGCFSRLSSTFNDAANPNAVNTPYNQFIISGQQNAYPNTQTVVWEPRIGIAWSPFGSSKTVIRTGAGIFADQLPGALAEDAAFNSPGFNAFTLSNGSIAPGSAGSLFTTAAAANQALLSQFHSGGSFNSISAAVPGFVAPNFFNFPSTFDQPKYYKWNFEVQQELGARIVLRVNYSGMHGIHIPVDNGGLNGYCPTSICPAGFAGLPSSPANPALATVQQYLSAGTASYNGLTVSLQRRFSQGLTFNLNYTWSHALDDVSNGGIANLPFGILDTDPSIGFLTNPNNVRANYGNADYDVRNYLSATFVLTDMFRKARFHWGPNQVFGGWTLSGNWFWRSGLPFSVIDNADSSALFGLNFVGSVFATPTTNVAHVCTSVVNSPCFTAADFAPAGALTGFGTLGRNQFYGPHFFDIDASLMKDIRIREHVTFSFGAQAYNLLNHTNFDQPVNDIANPNFGSSIAAVGPPTSLLGSFVGAGSSPRFVEIKGLIRF
jgi:hypothetical protein